MQAIPLTLIRCVLPTLVGLSLLAPATRAGVIVVDLAGGGDFTSIDAALAAAVDGDMLVIKPGDYSTPLFTDLDGKALVIVGDIGGETILSTVWVHGLAAGETVVLRNLTIKQSTFSGLLGASLVADQNLGRLHVEDCLVLAQAVVGTTIPSLPGLRIANGSTVAVHRSTITGSDGFSTTNPPMGHPGPPGPGGNAILLQSGKLALYGVTAIGGDGGSGMATSQAGAPGGAALLADNTQVVVVGGSFTGGEGGLGVPPAAAAAGARVTGASGILNDLDASIVGGTGAPSVLLTGGATQDTWKGSSWMLELESPLRSREIGTVSATGPANEVFGLFVSFGMGYLPKASLHGVFLTGSPLIGPLIMATTNGSGNWSANFVAPDLAPFGLEGLLNVDQAIMVQDTGLVLSSATAYIQVQPPN